MRFCVVVRQPLSKQLYTGADFEITLVICIWGNYIILSNNYMSNELCNHITTKLFEEEFAEKKYNSLQYCV